MATQIPVALSLDAVALALGVSQGYLRQECRARRLAAWKETGWVLCERRGMKYKRERWRVSTAALAEWMREKERAFALASAPEQRRRKIRWWRKDWARHHGEPGMPTPHAASTR